MGTCDFSGMILSHEALGTQGVGYKRASGEEGRQTRDEVGLGATGSTGRKEHVPKEASPSFLHFPRLLGSWRQSHVTF